MREHKIERVDAPLDVFDLVFAAVAKVLPPEMPIELPGEDVIDEPVSRKAFGARVLSRLQFRPELRRAFAPVGTRETEELTRAEITGMRCDKIQEMSFLGRVAKGSQGFEMGRCQAHSAKILAVISCSSRIRRKRGASS